MPKVLVVDDALVIHLMESLKQARLCDASGRRCVGVALKEALVNSLCHGNLEIDSRSRKDGSFEYRTAVEQRRNELPYCDRRIQVEAGITHEEAVFVIRDQGKGFDPGILPDSNDPAQIEKSTGRGIILMRTFMDEVRYNDEGNAVTLVKRRGT